MTRRIFLGGSISLGLGTQVFAQQGAKDRIVALDWASAQYLLALGVIPLAMPEIANYRRLAVEPPVPVQVHELGLRMEPNLELLAFLRPHLLVCGNDLSPMIDPLQAIAPVHIFEQGTEQIGDSGRQEMMKLAEKLGMNDAFETLLLAVEKEYLVARARLRSYDGRPLFVVLILDSFRLLVFGANSLFQSVLDRLGLENAWDGATSPYGHTVVSVDRLAARPEARLLCVGSGGPVSPETVLAAPAIASMDFARARRVSVIDSVLFYGGLPAARRFARLASIALTEGMDE